MTSRHDARQAATKASARRPPLVLEAVYYAFALFFFFYLFVYFWTTEGGPTLLAMTLVPVAYVLFVLNALRENDLYPGLPPVANYAAGAIQIVLALAVGATTCTPSTTSLARRAPATGIRPTCSWAV